MGRVSFIALNYTGSAIFTPKYGHEISINLTQKQNTETKTKNRITKILEIIPTKNERRD